MIWRTAIRWALVTLALVLLSLQLFYAWAQAYYWQDLWLSRNQQAHWYFKRGDYGQAAARFEEPELRAWADYAAENFDRAAKFYRAQHTAQGYFNWANSLAHRELYAEAAQAYQFALWLQPDWPEAIANLELVMVLHGKNKQQQDQQGGSDGELGADDIAFDLKQKQQNQATEVDEMGDGELAKEQLQELWLRRLNTRPVDFLRRKFAYQQMVRQQRKADDLSAADASVVDKNVVNKGSVIGAEDEK